MLGCDNHKLRHNPSHKTSKVDLHADDASVVAERDLHFVSISADQLSLREISKLRIRLLIIHAKISACSLAENTTTLIPNSAES